MPRRAVVFATGFASRLDPGTGETPVPLLEIAGRPLIDRQLDALAGCGVRRVWLVTGDARVLHHHVGRRATLVRPFDDGPSHGLQALRLACAQLEPGGIVLDARVLFAPALLDRLVAAEYADALAVDATRRPGADATRVRLAGAFVFDLGTRVAVERADGESIGLMKVGPEGGRRLARIVGRMASDGPTAASDAIVELARTWPLLAVHGGDLPWLRITSREDLSHATRLVTRSGAGVFPLATTARPRCRAKTLGDTHAR